MKYIGWERLEVGAGFLEEALDPSRRFNPVEGMAFVVDNEGDLTAVHAGLNEAQQGQLNERYTRELLGEFRDSKEAIYHRDPLARSHTPAIATFLAGIAGEYHWAPLQTITPRDALSPNDQLAAVAQHGETLATESVDWPELVTSSIKRAARAKNRPFPNHADKQHVSEITESVVLAATDFPGIEAAPEHAEKMRKFKEDRRKELIHWLGMPGNLLVNAVSLGLIKEDREIGPAAHVRHITSMVLPSHKAAVAQHILSNSPALQAQLDEHPKEFRSSLRSLLKTD